MPRFRREVATGPETSRSGGFRIPPRVERGSRRQSIRKSGRLAGNPEGPTEYEALGAVRADLEGSEAPRVGRAGRGRGPE